jgi:hypothetical protein
MKGTVSTPQGPIGVEASEERIVIVIPAGMKADVALPGHVWVRDGHPLPPTSPVQDEITLNSAGRYEFVKMKIRRTPF